MFYIWRLLTPSHLVKNKSVGIDDLDLFIDLAYNKLLPETIDMNTEAGRFTIYSRLSTRPEVSLACALTAADSTAVWWDWS
jgi:hypothetical protein